jgi:hypothetical protein
MQQRQYQELFSPSAQPSHKPSSSVSLIFCLAGEGDGRGRKERRTKEKLALISIMRKNITCPINQPLLLRREVRQETFHEILQVTRIIASQKGRVRKPALVEIPCALHRQRIVARVRNRDFIPAVGFEGYCAVQAHGFAQAVGLCVREKDVVAAPEGLLHFGDAGVGEVVVGEWVGVTVLEIRRCLSDRREGTGGMEMLTRKL